VVNNLFPHFLEDPEQYRLSERHWQDLWGRTDPFDRETYRWTHPWLGTGSPDLKDGNPIFSAYSPVLGRGVRVVQTEPVGPGLDIQAWLDTFGGDITDPDRILELVISCTVSHAASEIALSLMSSWVRGESISFIYNDAGLPIPDGSHRAVRRVRSSGMAA
jgi:hypothetical protein